MGVQADWLAARIAADDDARQVTASTLLPRLIEYVRPRPETVVHMIDVGAGSGANQRWLTSRLPFRQRWTHLDQDPNILARTYGVAHTRFVVGGIDTLQDLLDDEQHDQEWNPILHLPLDRSVVTCAAVLDVLTRSDLALLCALIADRGVPALLSLSVTGTMIIDPPDAADEVLLEAFNAHQRRGGRAGPDAPELVVAQCRSAGISVDAMPTPWILDASADPTFVARFLRGRVDAAVEQDPTLRRVGAHWLRDRLARLALHEMHITVGHRDLLLLP